jgi:hypothetical protein
MRSIKQSTITWFLIRIEDALGAGITGLAFNAAGLSAKLSKGAGAAATKTLTAPDWQEVANGYYWVRVTAAEADTLGPGALVVTYQGTDQAREFVVFAADVDAVAAGVARLLSLNLDNAREDLMVYSGTDLTSSRLRAWDSAANANAGGATGLVASWDLTFTYSAPGVLSEAKQVRTL